MYPPISPCWPRLQGIDVSSSDRLLWRDRGTYSMLGLICSAGPDIGKEREANQYYIRGEMENDSLESC